MIGVRAKRAWEKKRGESVGERRKRGRKGGKEGTEFVMARNTGKPIAFEIKPPARNGLERRKGRWEGWREEVGTTEEGKWVYSL